MEHPPHTRRSSILRRITFMSWMVAVMSVVIFAAIMMRYQRESFHRELQYRAKNLASNIENEIGRAIARQDYPAVVIYCLKLLEKNRDIAYVVTSWPGKQALVHYSNGQFSQEPLGDNWNNDAETPELAAMLTSDLPLLKGRKFFHFATPCSAEGISAGRIHVGMGLESYEANVRGVYLTTGIVGGLTLVTGALAAWIFARRLTEPIKSLQAFACKVATGALSARVDIRSRDELGELADSINTMVEALETSQTKLRDSVKSEAAAREKEILLREIHHRVKNNMQILTSLLRLQARRANSRQLRTVLMESEARIRSMGLLHEKLYQSESVSAIDMQSYLRTLTNELVRVNTPPGRRREIKLGVHEVYLGMDTALPCGLIVTELVSNALKYAFPEQVEGHIYVSISRERAGEFTLIVWDNGVGIPADMDLNRSESLGMRLVSMLADQLNGKITLTTDQGTRWEIKFRETQYKIRI